MPCHRSHIDYLLLSYVLYHQGLVPPHIAAGIKGNRLYSAIFREYLGELFHRGYSVEYFIEGGRSRTGRLLAPKTGMMSMTLQALQHNQTRPISVVPVYIGYEHVLEVDTYAKELRGAAKEKENAGLVLRVIKNYVNLGQGFVISVSQSHFQITSIIIIQNGKNNIMKINHTGLTMRLGLFLIK